jgi:hypothetical protein
MKSKGFTRALMWFCVFVVICCAASCGEKTECEVYNGGVKVDTRCSRYCDWSYGGTYYKDTGRPCE